MHSSLKISAPLPSFPRRQQTPVLSFPRRRESILRNDSGSLRMSLGLVFVMIVMILIFSFIDSVDRASSTSTAPDTTRGFKETLEDPFFDDAKYQNQPQVISPKEKELKDLTEEDVDPTLDPQYQETNAKNAYYHPLTEEKKREKEKLKQQRAKSTGQ